MEGEREREREKESKVKIYLEVAFGEQIASHSKFSLACIVVVALLRVVYHLLKRGNSQ